MRFRNLSLAAKQFLGFGIVVIFMVLASLSAIVNLGELSADLDEVSKNWLPRGIAISDVDNNTSDLRLLQLQRALATDSVQKQELATSMISLIDNINASLDIYDSLKAESEERGEYSDREHQAYIDFIRLWEDYQDLSIQYQILLWENEIETAIGLLNNEARDVFDRFNVHLMELVQINKNNSIEAAERAKHTYNHTKNFSRILLIVTVIFSVLFAGWLVRYITVPVRKLASAAETVATGDLNVELEISSKDEIGELSGSFNQMTVSLRQAREKTQQQSTRLQEQNRVLRQTYEQLQEKSHSLELHQAEIEQKNIDLERAMKNLKRTQEQLLRSEKMASLGDLVAGVAHEINNPIGSVIASTDVSARCARRIEEFFKNGPNIEASAEIYKSLEVLRKSLQTTSSAGDRVATIVKSLKNFARLDEVQYQSVDLHEGIESCLTLIANELQNTEVVREYGSLPRVPCSPSQINQVLMNVLKNAVHAVEDDGTIYIKSFADGGNAHVVIADNGKGMPADKLERVFEFGFSSGGGRIKMGSGLVSAYNIIQDHKGEISIDSEVDRGTTVTISLPLS